MTLSLCLSSVRWLRNTEVKPRSGHHAIEDVDRISFSRKENGHKVIALSYPTKSDLTIWSSSLLRVCVQHCLLSETK